MYFCYGLLARTFGYLDQKDGGVRNPSWSRTNIALRATANGRVMGHRAIGKLLDVHHEGVLCAGKGFTSRGISPDQDCPRKVRFRQYSPPSSHK